MCKKVGIPILGVVENMSWFIDSAGVRHELFGKGGGEAVGGGDLLGKQAVGGWDVHRRKCGVLGLQHAAQGAQRGLGDGRLSLGVGHGVLPLRACMLACSCIFSIWR